MTMYLMDFKHFYDICIRLKGMQILLKSEPLTDVWQLYKSLNATRARGQEVTN